MLASVGGGGLQISCDLESAILCQRPHLRSALLLCVGIMALTWGPGEKLESQTYQG